MTSQDISTYLAGGAILLSAGEGIFLFNMISELQEQVKELTVKVEVLTSDNVKLSRVPGRVSDLEDGLDKQREKLNSQRKTVRTVKKNVERCTRMLTAPEEPTPIQIPDSYSIVKPAMIKEKKKSKKCVNVPDEESDDPYG